ncbi:tetratricopeptide repeat protein [Brevundimonas diminuta]|jgi:tetratricopeptide (TPR) repeat protein|uniref:Tetratricopeptide repeat protein n=2 Tax=Pseudomonadota TaxID=1224 RepID=A0A410P135_BREDI|nr:tetratricopeptide repeat protein [Brevundimonas diminuta]MBD3574177.1 tetratricopeptide repeat protein [Brevundimonas diminuta]QAT15892.1 tetratricopeptide repeat protein [Brevundimonas diminuta]QQB89890.1 tetratricopeptide repeat protein [Brevundimonas diminuta]
MRFVSSRPVLFLAASALALSLAAPSLAQQAPEPAPETPAEAPAGQDAELNGDPVPHIIIADEPETPEEPEAAPIPAVWAPIPLDAHRNSAFGLYLAGRNALTSGESAVGADYLSRVYALTPEQPRVREQAFTAALLAGDLDEAGRIAPIDPEVSPVIVQAGRLVQAVQAYAGGDARRADALLKDAPVGEPHDRAGFYVQGWIAAAAKNWDRALALPPADFDPVSAMVARANRARLLEQRRRYDEADAEWRDLTSHAITGALFRQPYGEYLERRGRRDDALVQYDAAITAGTADRRVIQGRERVLAKGRQPALPSFRQGAAQALRTAADQMIAQRAHEFGVVYLRLAQNLDPNDNTQLLIGQTLIQGGIEPAGRAALAEVSEASPALYAAARIQTAISLGKAGRDEEALVELRRAAAARPDEAGVAYMLAGQLMQMERHEAALELLNGPLLNKADQGFEVHFLRGAAYESLDRDTEAEAELWAALQMQPDNPTLLNYLGYLWVDTGTRVQEGAAMIARAHAAEPKDGNIQDSLGWAQYRQGQYEAAVVNLEGAVDKEPANAEINDHLGDAYWAVGRQREAGFQWNRVLTLEVDDKRRGEVEAKLRDRLGQDPTGDKGLGSAGGAAD